MFGFILTTLLTFAILVTLTKCQSNGTVWCPKHLQAAGEEHSPYRNCGPHHCMYHNDSNTQLNNSSLCLSEELSGVQIAIMTSESCQWVRLHQDRHFNLNHSDGSIYENKTNITYNMFEYVYLPHLKEAIVCRKQLLHGNITEDITLWCSSHTIPLDEPPKNGSLYLPQLNLTISEGLYNVHNDSKQVDVCLDMDLDFMRCQSIIPLTDSTDSFHLQGDLSFVVKHEDGSKDNVHPVGHYYLSADNTTLLVCAPPVAEEVLFHGYMYPLHILSAIFLFLTLLVHLFYPKLNYHAKALVCHVFSMMVMYICRAVHRFNYRVESVAGRFTLFAFFYVSLMSTFLWLSVVAYDVWKVFNNLRGSSVGIGSQMDTKRWFVVKCVYAWGLPVVVCALVIGLAHDHAASQYLKIHLLNNQTSFFDANESMFMFVYGPITAILVVNMVFFGLTIFNIRRASRMTSTISRKMSKKLFYLSVKLFVVMGISWVGDVISFISNKHTAKEFYWSDVITALQGVAIFLVYVCKRSTWWMMKRRCCGGADDASSETKSTEGGRGRLASVDSSGGGGNRKHSGQNGNRKQSKAEIALVDYNNHA